MGQAVVDHSHVGIHKGGHHRCQENADHRVEQHRLDPLQRLGKLLKEFAQAQHNVAAHKTRKQRAQETGIHVAARRIGEGGTHLGDQTGHQAHCKAGTVRDAHGDETGQDRQHHAEGLFADGL